MKLIFSLCRAFLAGIDQEISQIGLNLIQKKIPERFFIKREYHCFALGFFLDNEAGNILGVIVSSPKEAKLLTCSCSNLLEARPWQFSTLCSPFVLQTPNKPQPVQYLGGWGEKKTNCILSAKCSDFRWDVYNVDLGFWYIQYAKRFVKY